MTDRPVVRSSRHSERAPARSRRPSTSTASAGGASTRTAASAGSTRTWWGSSPSAGSTSAEGASALVRSSSWAMGPPGGMPVPGHQVRPHARPVVLRRRTPRRCGTRESPKLPGESVQPGRAAVDHPRRPPPPGGADRDHSPARTGERVLLAADGVPVLARHSPARDGAPGRSPSSWRTASRGRRRRRRRAAWRGCWPGPAVWWRSTSAGTGAPAA